VKIKNKKSTQKVNRFFEKSVEKTGQLVFVNFPAGRFPVIAL